ncbi:hypothetical protein CL645_01250 [bacterium]|nr:hypothetical protein [bacterium]|tara:strand:+ start:1040 stop:1432 length:393 start_codon:yes stop_codon:yes gene_type:complete
MSDFQEKKYSIKEAEKLIPVLKKDFKKIVELKKKLDDIGFDIVYGTFREGCSPNGTGSLPQDFLDFCAIIENNFHKVGILLRSLDEGIVDFPAKRGKEDVFITWIYPDAKINYWYFPEEGYQEKKSIVDF